MRRSLPSKPSQSQQNSVAAEKINANKQESRNSHHVELVSFEVVDRQIRVEAVMVTQERVCISG